jgi:hypothetical protein
MVECIRTHVSGAVYSITDMIIFNEYKDLHSSDKYLNVVVLEDDIIEHKTVFLWTEIPEDIMDILQYVTKTSSLEYDENDNMVLYGNHIGRVKNYRYNLMTFLGNGFDIYEVVDKSQKTDEDRIIKICSEIAENMKIVKKLV